MMRLPDFLIIGAQKAGTTTLYRDLLSNPNIYMPDDKEPGNLGDDHILSVEGKTQYAKLFVRAQKKQLCGEASTGYTKRPDIEGVAKRARTLLGPDLKIIYLVRQPVARTISHHNHLANNGRAPHDINLAIQELPCLINYSRYAMQAAPWVDAFGHHAIRFIQFEDYIANRKKTIACLGTFLGTKLHPELIDEGKNYNPSSGKPLIHGSKWKAIQQSRIYLKMVRPWLSHDTRRWLSGKLLPKAPTALTPPTKTTVQYIVDQVQEDTLQLAKLTGSPRQWWDLNEVLENYKKQ